jgi:hypothetical protein
MTELLTHPNGAAPTAPPITAAAAPPAARDFSRKRKPLTFTIDDDTFEAARAMPAETYAEFVATYTGVEDNAGTQDIYKAMSTALQLVLLPDSFTRFSERLRDRTNPIDLEQMTDVILWLMGEYGMRPTQPSQPSSDGPASPESGTSSTENTQPAESTSAPSQPTAS